MSIPFIYVKFLLFSLLFLFTHYYDILNLEEKKKKKIARCKVGLTWICWEDKYLGEFP